MPDRGCIAHGLLDPSFQIVYQAVIAMVNRWFSAVTPGADQAARFF